MNNAQLEELFTEVQAALTEDVRVRVSIPAKSGIMLFGAVIAGNIATIAVAGAIASWAKEYTEKVKAKKAELEAADEAVMD